MPACYDRLEDLPSYGQCAVDVMRGELLVVLQSEDPVDSIVFGIVVRKYWYSCTVASVEIVEVLRNKVNFRRAPMQ
jgi:hypothetical protein